MIHYSLVRCKKASMIFDYLLGPARLGIIEQSNILRLAICRIAVFGPLTNFHHMAKAFFLSLPHTTQLMIMRNHDSLRAIPPTAFNLSIRAAGALLAAK